MAQNRRRLTSLPGQLHAEGYEGVQLYKVLHQHAVNGVIPGAHQINSLWYYFEDDVPAIAAALGLTRPASSSTEHSARSQQHLAA